MTPCFCGRSPRGFAWHDFRVTAWERKAPQYCCSMQCLNTVSKNKGEKIVVTADMEGKAVAGASAAVGEFLEALGKTDLATMTPEEWAAFILHAHRCVAAEVSRLCYEDTPF